MSSKWPNKQTSLGGTGGRTAIGERRLRRFYCVIFFILCIFVAFLLKATLVFKNLLKTRLLFSDKIVCEERNDSDSAHNKIWYCICLRHSLNNSKIVFARQLFLYCVLWVFVCRSWLAETLIEKRKQLSSCYFSFVLLTFYRLCQQEFIKYLVSTVENFQITTCGVSLLGKAKWFLCMPSEANKLLVLFQPNYEKYFCTKSGSQFTTNLQQY